MPKAGTKRKKDSPKGKPTKGKTGKGKLSKLKPSKNGRKAAKAEDGTAKNATVKTKATAKRADKDGRARARKDGQATAKRAEKPSGKALQGKQPPLTKGDEVSWQSHGSVVEGTVERAITKPTKASGRAVSASPQEPQYEVRSAKSGRTAVHKPKALKKKG